MGSYYIPPVNFGMVEDNLYRSGQPGELNFPFLEKLKLKKILYLSNEDPPSSFQNFVSEQGIEFEPLGSFQYFALCPLKFEVHGSVREIMIDTRFIQEILGKSASPRKDTGARCPKKMLKWPSNKFST